MEQNPYEAPQTSEASSHGKSIKQGIGCGVIALLTPPAVLIAFGGSCLVGNLVLPAANISNIDTVIKIATYGLLLPPAIVLIAMVAWGVSTFLKAK
jgi:hypothetical protein